MSEYTQWCAEYGVSPDDEHQLQRYNDFVWYAPPDAACPPPWTPHTTDTINHLR